MRKIALLIAAIGLPSCTRSYVPEQPDFTLELAGNYQSLSDCAYLKIREKYPNWSKVELPSMKKSQLLFGSEMAQIGVIDFIDAGGGRTSVRSHVWKQIHGADYWPSRLRPIVQSCAG